MGQNNKWSSAALNGLLLSIITIVYSLLVSVLEPKGFISILLWIVKFTGCIALLYYFMKQYSTSFNSITYGQSFNYGFILCAFSAIICSCFAFLSLTFIFPNQIDLVTEQIQQAMSAQNMDSDQEAKFEDWMKRLPELTMFFSLIYYIIFGAIASSIIANYTKKVDPFAKKQE
ncbi:MAG: DUF4199 domain-containing protein [Bacteroidales bacterium]